MRRGYYKGLAGPFPFGGSNVRRGSFACSGAGGAALVLMVAALVAAPAGRAQQPAGPRLSVGEGIGVARLSQIRSMSEAFHFVLWPDFSPSSIPAIIHQPGGWAIAVGFDPIPEGFAPIEGVADGERPIYRLDRSVTQMLPGPPDRKSPARIAGQWCVVMEFEQPAAMPAGSHVGRRPAEQALADFMGDAFLLHVMKLRGASSPFVPVPSSWPEKAELIALSHVEQRILSRAIIYGPNERNMEGFHQLIRQLLAVRRARWRLLGPELSAAEQGIENWEGLRQYAIGQVYRLAFTGDAEMEAAAVGVDPTFDEFRGSNPMKTEVTHLPARLLASGPSTTPGQIVARTGVLTYLMDWLGHPAWREKCVAGDRPLIDLINEKIELKPEDEAALLDSAKADLRYDLSLRLAEEDLKSASAAREAELKRLFPEGPSRLTVRIADDLTLDSVVDPWTSAYVGEGRRLHPGGLRLSGGGLRLNLEAGLAEGALMTKTDRPLGTVRIVTLSLPLSARVLVGGKAWKPRSSPRELVPGKALEVAWPGLDLRCEAGRISKGPGGSIEVEIP